MLNYCLLLISKTVTPLHFKQEINLYKVLLVGSCLKPGNSYPILVSIDTTPTAAATIGHFPRNSTGKFLRLSGVN